MKLTVKQLINRITEKSPLNEFAWKSGYSYMAGWDYAKLYKAKRHELEELYHHLKREAIEA